MYGVFGLATAGRGRRATTCIGLLACAIALGGAVSPANALTITPIYAAGIDGADQAVIQSAINFYNTNITTPDPVSITVAFGTQAGGGASTTTFSTTVSYTSYLSALTATQTSAHDATALATLSAGPFNPVTGNTDISMRETLAAGLGLGPAPTNSAFSECAGLSAVACVQIGTNVLTGGPGGTPNGSLFGTTEHELDEVLGTSSGLFGTTTPSTPNVADLFRYGAPGVRSFSTNASTTEPCAVGTPTAYLSINGGTTNLNTYNNCNNGGDYGDWAEDTGVQVQDAFGPDDVPSSLNLGSPEVTLLDVIGFNITPAATGVPEPASLAILLPCVAGFFGWRRRVRKISLTSR